MKAAPRTRDSRGFTHSPGSRLSIDPDHHVTEAIGDMYGEFTDETGNRYSYIQSVHGETSRNRPQSTLSVPVMHGRDGGGGFGSAQNNGQTPPMSPSSTRSAGMGDGATKPFPLNNIDYESDPVAVAQEISNLQALRRMSMDASSKADPDLPSFNSFVPSTPPDDPGSVFWVPARLHPELAPQEFSAYLEAKKNEIRRPQARGDLLSPDGGLGAPSLRRKKSMLSRQIDAEGGRHYRDGADRLEKRKSLRGEGATGVQLDDFMKDPTALMHKLSVDSQRRIDEGGQVDDVPIIFAPKVGLKRSTATHYRKASMRRGERVGSKRTAAAKAAETDGEEGDASVVPKVGFRLDRISTEPISPPSQDKNEPKPMRRSPALTSSTASQDLPPKATPPSTTVSDKHKSAPAKTRRSTSPKGVVRTRTSEPPPPVPKIVETPPPIVEHPDRHSSSEFAPGSLKKRPALNRLSDSSSDVSSSKPEHMAVPDLKGDKKDRKRPDSSGSTGKDRKTSWGWLLGDSDKDKEKEEKREREKEEKFKAKKERRPKSADKTDKYDNTRLDVLQKSIELGNTSKLVAADPVAVASIEPPRADVRKSRTDDKKEKEKDSGFLSFFGSSRKKSGDHSASEKKGRSSRGTSPDPPHEKPQPFYYARFPIHIERAIYRLSHLKLANPRRPLHQQVLLSNFMYSYLAKVQQTQPHLIQQATVSPSQQQKQAAIAEQQRQQEQQRWQQRQEEQQQYSDASHYYEDGSKDQSTDYVDDSQNYEYDDETSQRPRSRHAQYVGDGHKSDNEYYEQHSSHHQGMDQSEHSNGEGDYYENYNRAAARQQQQQKNGTRDERDDMW